jgi:phosphoserine phosphatase
MRLFFLFFFVVGSLGADELPSWNEGPAKQALLSFVERAVREIAPADRIATFDEDGTLWVEQPLYPEFVFAMDTLPGIIARHPEWRNEQPYQAVLESDKEKMLDFPKSNIAKILAATHAGMTVEAFHRKVQKWLETTAHPRFKKPFTQLIYQPMVEVIELLRKNGFKVYIVSGGGQEFIRAFAKPTYGIEPEHVIGTAGKVKYTYQVGQPVMMKLPEVLFIDDKSGKPEAIQLIIGKHPAAAFGNSTGDREMLEWTQGRQGPSLQMLVHHDDAEREYSYGPESKVGTFSEALMSEALEKGWIVISMKKDWKVLFK